MGWWTNTPGVWLTWSLWAVGAGVHILSMLVLTGTPSAVWRDGASLSVSSNVVLVSWQSLGEGRSLAGLGGRLARGSLWPHSPGDTRQGQTLPSSSGWGGSHTRAEGELILSLVLDASCEHSCFSGLENPGFPSPYLDNSWTADRYWTLESNGSS